MTALAKARQEQRIVDEFHHMIAVNPDHAEDSAWLITATAYTLGEDEQDVRRIWDARFRDHGVA
ncbi:hypothetical protein ACHFJ0_04820 [Paracoccus sp. NGMCC 1.201697]|uniref:Uncharacterized protein n=1 Tax=Paracoccus broussonetiae subsp. drimophilus TaxID=3373869 RepID=A0ABW7LGU2_9RHOB